MASREPRAIEPVKDVSPRDYHPLSASLWRAGSHQPPYILTMPRNGRDRAEAHRLLFRVGVNSAHLLSPTRPASDVLSLSGDRPSDELVARGALGRAFDSVLRTQPRDAAHQPWAAAHRALRSWIATRLWSRGAPVGSDDVILTSGASAALHIATEIVLDPADRIEVDHWSYAGALDLFRKAGANLVEKSAIRPSAAYVMPGLSNPLARGLPNERKAQLLAYGCPLIADEAYAELRFDGELDPPLLAQARDRTFHIGSFSKALACGIRLGYLIPPPLYLKRARALNRAMGGETGSLVHGVLAEFLSSDHYDARLARARRHYEARAIRMVRALRKRFPSFRIHEPEGGFSVFVESDCDGDELALLEAASARGVTFEPGSSFHPSACPSPVAMRVSFANLPQLRIDEAVSRLHDAWRDWCKVPSVDRVPVAPRNSEIRQLRPPPGATFDWSSAAGSSWDPA